MRRPLAPEDIALWARVVRDVRPLGGRRKAVAAPPERLAEPIVTVAQQPARLAAKTAVSSITIHSTLDAGWDRRLARGLVAPDLTLDLHGHTLAAAHAALDTGLARAVGQGARLVLLVTGRPPKGDRPLHGPQRGAIRAAIHDWLAMSGHADRIAAVRPAHLRHGGAGALYVVMRRARGR